MKTGLLFGRVRENCPHVGNFQADRKNVRDCYVVTATRQYTPREGRKGMLYILEKITRKVERPYLAK